MPKGHCLLDTDPQSPAVGIEGLAQNVLPLPRRNGGVAIFHCGQDHPAKTTDLVLSRTTPQIQIDSFVLFVNDTGRLRQSR